MNVKLNNEELTVYADMYSAKNFMMRDRTVIALHLKDQDGCPYADITKGFGEFIGQPGITFLDGNALYDVEALVKDNGIGVRAPFAKKLSGFCEYPPYIINPWFLEKAYKDDTLKEYLGQYDFDNAHILDDEEYAKKMEQLKEAYREYCEAKGFTVKTDFK